MQYQEHPDIKKKWSAITLGTWQIAPSEGWGDRATPADAEATVKTALECGITAFDTAEGYGDNEAERRLGKALGADKDDVIIISKIWPDAELTLEAYQERLEGTLRALERDYVDLYLIHGPAYYFNSEEKSQKLTDIMCELQESGKATAVGLSNFHYQDLKLLKDNLGKFSMNQVPYNPLKRFYEGETRELCKQFEVPYMAYGPTNRGLLARQMSDEDLKLPTRTDRPLFTEPLYSEVQKLYDVLVRIGDEMDALPIEVVLAWVMQQENIFTAIMGSYKPDQVREFAKAGALELSTYQLAKISNASDVFQKAAQNIDIRRS